MWVGIDGMRVFHLIKSLGRGGAEMLLPETLRHADRERFAYDYGFFLPSKRALVPALEIQGASVVCFGAANNASILLAASRVARHVRRLNADLIHCHLPIAGVVGRIAGKLARIPVVYTEHNLQERYNPITRRLNLATWRWQERVVAVSGDVAESIRNHASARIPVEVVRNGVDVDRFDRDRSDAAVRSALNIPPGAPVVGTVAVFRVQKRLDDWLKAARILRTRHPTIHFVLVGDGPLRGELLTKAAALDLDDCIHWPGLQQDVRPYLAAMDVYLISSMFEGLPVALLEAMSMRCAVVATAVGGIPEVIRDGQNGFLVEPGRPERLAEVTSTVLGTPAALARCGAAARRTVEDGFSIQRMTRALEGTYLDVMRGSKRAS
jgi:glycosyltransferase involved in cell wall biosynthesis